MMNNWAELTKDFQALLRPRTSLLAWKVLEKEKELEKIPGVRRIGHRFFFCQALTLARTLGWTIGASPARDDMWCPFTTYGGFMPAPPLLEPISDEDYSRSPLVTNYWVKTEEDARKRFGAIPKLPTGKYKAMVVGPLHLQSFEPDVILFYGDAAQMCLLINGLQWTDYERLQFFSVGEAACTDSIIQCFLSKKPALTVPCFGERAVGGAKDDELVMALPPKVFPKAIKGLEELFARGLRYPIAKIGAMTDPGPDFFEMTYGHKPERSPLIPEDIK